MCSSLVTTYMKSLNQCSLSEHIALPASLVGRLAHLPKIPCPFKLPALLCNLFIEKFKE